MSASGLHPVVLHHIVNTLEWPALRPLQEAAVAPLREGDDALLIAPTAGGKTEAALFPLLSRMASNEWRGLSVLYVCPLRALLNNLQPRIARYASWLGRRAELWHGDTPPGSRRRIGGSPPDVLLTTPESLEAMLVSTRVTPRDLFSDVRAVVVDEVHAFAGDDRGWHLLAVLERISRLAGQPLQRVGLSATVGNPGELLSWLQGSGAGHRPGVVIAPPSESPAGSDVQLDYVGSLANAATVIAALHRGEKRLVFAESRRAVESLAVALRDHGIDTFVSHSSLSLDERHRAEEAFAQGRDCVIVATSTLELGVDVGDLDRVIQVGTPRSVASFLQRFGRTGRRPGTTRNALFLAADDDDLLRSAALLTLWGEGYVEPVTPPPSPRQLVAQQLLGLCLQEGHVGDTTWPTWLEGLPLAEPTDYPTITAWLLETGHLDQDSGMLLVGPEAERRWGRRHFLELLSVFTADPQFLVLHGRIELGTVDPFVLVRRVEGPRVLALAGRSWQVNYVDWARHRVWVEPSDRPGMGGWFGLGQPSSYAVTDATRRVLLGAEPSGVRQSRRAAARLSTVRDRQAGLAHEAATLVVHDVSGARWWTWAGGRANAVIAAAFDRAAPGIVEAMDRYDDRYLRVRSDVSARDVSDGLARARDRFGSDLGGVEPDVTEEAVRALKFAELLPPQLAHDTLAARLGDHAGAGQIASRPVMGSLWRG